MMKSKALALVAAVLTMVAVSVQPAMAESVKKPNVIILFADDLGYADLGRFGNPYIRTPNLDRMADEGQRWTDFYVASAVCSPSRGALLTGKLPVKTGLYGNYLPVMHPGDPNGIPAKELTMAEALSSVGYRTGMFGKWHLGDSPDQFPTRHGFDYWFGIPYSNDMDEVGVPSIDEVIKSSTQGDRETVRKMLMTTLERFQQPKSEYWQVPLYRSEKNETGFRDEVVERPLQQPNFTQRLTEEAVAFIKNNAKDNFLVYLPYSMPHMPIFSGKEFAGTSLRGRYGDAVEELDWSVGRIRKTLEELGIANNTLVIFSSDNGPWQAYSVNDAGSAGMLRGSKGSTYEGGMRVPGIFWWPEHIAPGAVSDIGTTVDVYATILKLAGLTSPPDGDGYDLSQTLLSRETGPRLEMPFYQGSELMAYRKGPYKIHFTVQPDQLGQPKQVLDKPVLYDLRQDVSEKKDIAASRPEIVEELTLAARQHRESVAVQPPIFDRRLQPK